MINFQSIAAVAIAQSMLNRIIAHALVFRGTTIKGGGWVGGGGGGGGRIPFNMREHDSVVQKPCKFMHVA